MPVKSSVDLSKRYNDASQFRLGAQYVDEATGKVYRFAKYLDGETAVTGAAGYGVWGIREHPYHVTRDYDATTTNCNTVLGKHKGYLQAALEDGEYGWVQTKGKNNKALVASASTTGRNVHLIANQSGNGTVTALAIGTADTNARKYIVGRSQAANKTTASTTFAANTVIIDTEDQW